MTDLPINAPSPRLCHMVKWPEFDGYGFNIHADKSKPGQYIGKVDENSPAEASGLREGDRIVEVNGVNISNENHKQVVQRIRAVSNETRLLVVDSEADRWYKTHNFVVRGDQANIVTGTSQRPVPPDSPTPSADKENNPSMNEDSKSVESTSSTHSEKSSLPQLDNKSNGPPCLEPEPIPPCTREEELRSDSEGEQCPPYAEVEQSSTENKSNVKQSPVEAEPEVEQSRIETEPKVDQCPNETGSEMERCSPPETEMEHGSLETPLKEELTADTAEMEKTSSDTEHEEKEDRDQSSDTKEEQRSSELNNEADPVLEHDSVRFQQEGATNEATSAATEPSRTSEDRNSVSSSGSIGRTKPEPENNQPKVVPEEEERKSPMSTTPSPPPSLNPDRNLSNRSSPQNSLPPSSNGGLNLNMTAAEMRAHLATRKKFDPRKDTIDLKQKFHIVQNM